MRESNNDIVDVFLYPKYEKLVRFIPGWITPNQLTIIGFIFGISASLSLVVISHKISFLISSVFLYLWSLFDSLDGICARHNNMKSEFGGFLDHFLDAVAVMFLYTATLYAFQLQQIVFILTLSFRLLLSISTYVVSSYVGELYLPKIGPTCEQFLFIFFLVLSYLFPGDIVSFSSNLSFLQSITGMPGISIVGLALILLFLATPFTLFEHFAIARKALK